MFEITTQSINQLLISHHRTCQKQDRTLHMHNNAYELLLFKSGNVDYFINDVTFRLMPGDLIFICPNDIHGLFISDETPYERMPVHLEESFAASLSTPETDLFACFRKFTPDHPCHEHDDSDNALNNYDTHSRSHNFSEVLLLYQATTLFHQLRSLHIRRRWKDCHINRYQQRSPYNFPSDDNPLLTL